VSKATCTIHTITTHHHRRHQRRSRSTAGRVVHSQQCCWDTTLLEGSGTLAESVVPLSNITSRSSTMEAVNHSRGQSMGDMGDTRSATQQDVP
jgi:hypothetical protein